MASLEIDMINAAGDAEPPRERMEQAFGEAVERSDVALPEMAFVTVVTVDDARIAELAAQFRGSDGPTDVLAFSLNELDRETERVHFGEIVVSVDTARREAERRQAALSDELLLYAVHGFLHLLGYNDETEDERQEMADEQFAVLKAVGVDVSRLSQP
jgi:probable rRNA maturation factor